MNWKNLGAGRMRVLMAAALLALMSLPANASDYPSQIVTSVTPGTAEQVWVQVGPGVAHIRINSDCLDDVDAYLYTEDGLLVDSDRLDDCFPWLDGTAWLNYSRWYRVEIHAYGDYTTTVVVDAWAD